MLISQIVSVDAQSQRFAQDHAASLLAPSGGGDFDAYLARTMRREDAAGSVARPADPPSYSSDPYAVDPYHNDLYRPDQTHERHNAPNSASASVADPSAGERDRSVAADDQKAHKRRAAGETTDKQQKEAVEQKKQAETDKTDVLPGSHGSDEVEDDASAAASEAGDSDGGKASEEAAASAAARKAHEAIAAEVASVGSSAREATVSAVDAGETTPASLKQSQAAGSAGTSKSEKATGESRAKNRVDLEVHLPAAHEAAESREESGGHRGRVTDASNGESLEERLGTHAEKAQDTRAEDARTDDADAARAKRVLGQGATAESAKKLGEAAQQAAGERDRGAERRAAAKQEKIEVTDLRAKNATARANAQEGASHGKQQHTGDNGRGSGGESNAGRSFGELLGTENARGGGQTARGAANTVANRAADQLAQNLKENLNSEIVRQARFIVRNNDSGEIKLHLRPESLGSVRIALQMQDGHIAGRIIVDNQTVREVFEQNLAALERAFAESGMETGGLDVMVGDSGDQGSGDNTQSGRGTATSRAHDRLATSVPAIETYDEHELVDVTV